MKLHLPSSLLHTLLASLSVFAATLGTSNTYASMMYSDSSLVTYTDFGQNMGRYVAGDKVNELLAHIRSEQGTLIETKDGNDRALEHGIIDFGSSGDAGSPSALISVNSIATVEHNSALSPTYSVANIHYTGIEYRDTDNLQHKSGSFDFKITRLSKVVTDEVATPVYQGSKDSLNNVVLFHTGSGTQRYLYADSWEGPWTQISGAYSYETGGVGTGSKAGMYPDGYIFVQYQMKPDQILPYIGQAGDSGSAYWIWNDSTQRYEYIGAYALITKYDDPNAYGGVELDQVLVNNMAATKATTRIQGGSTFTISTVVEQGETYVGHKDSGDHAVVSQGTEYYSAVQDAQGKQIGKVYRAKSGLNTWGKLNPVMDQDDWYSYGSSYLNVTDDLSRTDVSTRADLYLTQDACFTATSGGTTTLELQERLDTGIGYTQFSKDAGVDSADFVVKAAQGATGAMLNSGGFVVNAGVNLHLQFNCEADYVREWRKVGEGNLYIDGTGDTNALLNVGGTGKVFLDRKEGYAAYNVIANTGATVELTGGIDQIARDFTFGNGTSYLDFHGNSMTWDNSADVDEAGFHIHALTEEGRITNSTGTATITVRDGGDSFSSSFVDTANGAVKMVYAGESGNTWQLTTIHTDLTQNNGSGFEVLSGAVRLGGTNTIHAEGSLTGTNKNRYFSENDWHYADAKMNVQVDSGANFTLGSHARLTGSVTVDNGGTLVLEEGVRYAQEYVEGSTHLEDTAQYRQFYGLKGDIVNNGEVHVRFGAGTETNYLYEHNVSGSGSMVFDLGLDGGTFTMTGTASEGKKTVVSGGVVANGTALGSTGETWLVQEKGFLAVDASANPSAVINRIDANSNGILALTSNTGSQFDLSGHKQLIIGAYGPDEVHYGSAETELTAVDHEWHLGGAGGTLVVDSALNDADGTLVLGNDYATGTVKLTNQQNNIGTIRIQGAVNLEYDSNALGQSAIQAGYAARIGGGELGNRVVGEGSQGVRLLEDSSTMDMTSFGEMAVGSAGDATLSGLEVQNGAAYRIGGVSNGTLSVMASLQGGHDLVVDNQTYKGGIVDLTSGKALNRTLTVEGYDADKTTNHSGDVALRLMEDNTLENVTTVNIKDGGTLDVQGYSQNLRNLNVQSGGSVTGSGEISGTVSLTGRSGVAGNVDVGTLEITQEATLNITGSVQADCFNASSVSSTTVGEDGTLLLKTASAANEQVDLTTVSNHGTVSVAVSTDQSGTNVVNMGVGSDGRVVLRSGTLSYQSDLAQSTLVMEEGSRLIFGERSGSRDAVFGNNIELAGNAYVRVYGTSRFDSVELTGNVTGNYTLTKHDGNQSTSFTGKLDLVGMNVQSGTVVLDGDSTDRNNLGAISVTGGATADIRNTDVGRITMAQAGNISNRDESADAMAADNLKITANGTQATVTGTDSARLEYAAVNIAEGSSLTLQDVMLATNSAIYGSSASLQARDLQLEARVGSNLINVGTGSLPDNLQVLTYGDDRTITVQQQETAVQFTLTNIQDVQISGSGLVISMADGLNHSSLYGYDWMEVQISGSTLQTDLPVWLEYVDAGGTVQRLEGYYSVAVAEAAALAEASAEQQDHVYFHIAGAVVPEPATGTLSLLALAGLMARRRRKN